MTARYVERPSRAPGGVVSRVPGPNSRHFGRAGTLARTAAPVRLIGTQTSQEHAARQGPSFDGGAIFDLMAAVPSPVKETLKQLSASTPRVA